MLHAFRAVGTAQRARPGSARAPRRSGGAAGSPAHLLAPRKCIDADRTREQVTSKERHRSKTKNARAHSHRTWFPQRARALITRHDRTSGGMPNRNPQPTYIVSLSWTVHITVHSYSRLLTYHVTSTQRNRC